MTSGSASLSCGIKSIWIFVSLLSSNVAAFSSSSRLNLLRPTVKITSQQQSVLPSLSFSSSISSSSSKKSPSSSVQCWAFNKSNDDESSSDNNCNNKLSSLSFLSDNKGKAAAAVATLAAASIVLSPAVSNAALPAIASDTITSITGGAGEASALMDKFTETGFYQAFSLVFLSELGDKTFFIAGLLAMKTSKLVSFVGSLGALAVMTIISVLIGQIFHQVPAGIAGGIPLDDLAAVLAFTFFGFKTLKEAFDMEEDGKSVIDEELEEAEEAVEGSQAIRQATAWAQIFSTFGLVFAAEFGDRSFLATIALSAAQNPFYVAAGSIAAHGLATGVAVVSGSVIAKYISEKVIGIIGGTLFLVFAATTALGIF